jgi:phosphoglucomutase
MPDTLEQAPAISPLAGHSARPSGTENVYKIYAESLRNQAHLNAIVEEATQIVSHALDA